MSTKQIKTLIFASFACGVAWVLGLQFILIDESPTHYHADFAIYIHGQQDLLDNFLFYEEVSACSPSSAVRPESRVHLHDNIPTVVHVHDLAVTWGHLFANLGYNLGDSSLATPRGYFVDDTSGSLRFILNGREVRHVANQRINDLDVLLVDYSLDSKDTLESRHQAIPRSAVVANQQGDPQACSGDYAESVWQRLRRVLLGS